VRVIRAILQRPPDEIDLGKAKVTIDKLVDPAIDTEATLQKLDFMVSRIRLMPEFGDTGDSKVRALKRYLYESGTSNENQPFHYDLTDPLGHNIRNKLLSNYLATMQGNCVTMPLLFVILGQRLGIDVTLSTAPKHLLVKFNSEEYGHWINLEATSGANPARDVWIRQEFPSITDESLASGVYLQPLTKKETVAQMAEIVAEHHYQKGEYDKAIVISNLALDYYPKDVGAMTMNGTAYLRLLRKHFMDKYPSSDQIPVAERGYFQYLAQNNAQWFDKAEALGWRQPSKEEDDEYLQNVDRARQRKASMNMN
jgi:regulator of sirC expression with transglutaminase-like and TPR domain